MQASIQAHQTAGNVTIEQWEDFAENDCPGVYKKIQKAFAKYPVAIFRRCEQWIAYCKYLNATYGHLLPEGHVFRLPSEAEWEYAYFGGERRDKIDSNEIWTETDGHKRAFAKMLKKNKGVASLGKWRENGLFHDIFIGGRAKPHRWGFCDMRMAAAQMMLDTFDYECKEWHGEAAKHIFYPDKAIDPLNWAGDKANRCLLRQNFTARWNVGYDFNDVVAHIVIGPDIVNEYEVRKNLKVKQKDLPTAKLPVLQAEINDKVVKAGNITIPKKCHMTIDLPGGEQLKFVKCEKGTFTMGYQENDDIHRRHKVTISRDYWFSQYPLTKGQWNALMGDVNDKSGGVEGGLSWKNKAKESDKHQLVLDSLSALQVKGIPEGYVVRFPSEAEWEYALKGAKKNKYYWDYELSSDDRAKIESDINADVGLQKPNTRGIYDMIVDNRTHGGHEYMLDTFDRKNESLISYGQWGELKSLVYKNAVTRDPLFHFEGAGVVRLQRRFGSNLSKHIGGFQRRIRLCIGPDLVKEKKAGK